MSCGIRLQSQWYNQPYLSRFIRMRASCQLFDACAEIDQEPHFVKLNQTSIAVAPLLFYTIIGIEVSEYFIIIQLYMLMEILLCVIAIILLPFLCLSVLRAGDFSFEIWISSRFDSGIIHRNFRYQVCLASCYYVLAACGRLVLLQYQLLEWPISGALSLIGFLDPLPSVISIVYIFFSVTDPVIFVCDLLRDMVLGYFCSL